MNTQPSQAPQETKKIRLRLTLPETYIKLINADLELLRKVKPKAKIQDALEAWIVDHWRLKNSKKEPTFVQIGVSQIKILKDVRKILIDLKNEGRPEEVEKKLEETLDKIEALLLARVLASQHSFFLPSYTEEKI